MSRPPTDTESRLYDSALTLFATKGYAATSVQDILDQVGLSKPVLYYYCDSKLDLFEKLVRRKQDAAYENLESLCQGEGSPMEKLHAIIRGTFAFCAADWRVPRLMFGASYGPEDAAIHALMVAYGEKRFSLIGSLIAEAIDSGEVRFASASPPTFGFCALMDHPSNVLTSDPTLVAQLTPELADDLFELFWRGVRSPLEENAAKS